MSVLEEDSMIALQLSRESYVVFPLSTVMLVRQLQPENELKPIDATEFGIVRLVRPSQ